MDPITIAMHIEQALQKPTEHHTVHRIRQRAKVKSQKYVPYRTFDEDKQQVKFERFCLTSDYSSVMLSSTVGAPKCQDADSVRFLKLSALQQSKFLSFPNIPMTINLTPYLGNDSPPSTSLEAQQLKLIYHYNAVACGNLASSHTPQSKSLWSVATPRMAFQSPVVLHSLLALSAIHLSQLLPYDQNLFHISLKHFTTALSLHRTTMSHVDSTNAEPVLAASVLLGTYTWLSRHVKDTQDDEEVYEIPLHTYRMIRGVGTLSSQVAPLLLFQSPKDWYNNTSSTVEEVLPSPKPEDHITPWLNPANDNISWSDSPPPSPSPSTSQLPSLSTTPRQKFFQDAQEDLSRLYTAFTDTPIPPQEAFTYRLGLVELSTLHSIIVSPSQPSITELHRRILNFPLRLPKEFLDALDKKSPIAMALLARSLALLCVVGGEDAWWIFGASNLSAGNSVYGQAKGKIESIPAREVRGLASLMGKEWKWVMEWPLKVVSGEIGFGG